ncbi:MAG: ParB/RepB/Spo0J family partition protein [Azonexaceae bacterium]|nr:ParB/RepB/Spo0J family partition protein [Azonexaceae bacterium]
MTFKDSSAQFQTIDVMLLDRDPKHARQNINEDTIKGLVNSIQKVGIIHPLVVRPADQPGRYTVVVGERRRQAAIQAGEKTVPVVIRACSPDDTLEIQVFENIGLGVRSALEPRDMANAIQAIADRFTTPEEAAQHFGRAPTWLSQATAAANLSEKVTALLDSGKISSTSAAIQIEKLAKKNEAKAETLIEQIEQLPEGEKVSKKVVDNALSEETGRGKKKEEPSAAEPAVIAAPIPVPVETAAATVTTPPWEEAPAVPAAPSSSRSKVNPNKVKLVAELLGLSDEDEEDILVRLIDEFIAMKNA